MVINIQNQWQSDRPFNLLAWGHWFTFANLLLALLFSFFYITSEPSPTTLVGWIYLLVSWVGHFSFLALSCFLLTIFPVITIFPYKRHIRGVSAIFASLFQLLLFLDVLAYRGLGYHLSATSFQQLSEVEDVYVATLGNGYWALLLAVFAFILLFEFVASNFTWKRIHRLQSIKFKNQIATSLLSAFFVSHAIHIWADATLNTDIAKQSAMFPASYPMTAKSLLARYELIDLQELEAGRTQQTNLDNSTAIIKPFSKMQCDISDKPDLNIYFVEKHNLNAVKSFLVKNNVQYQQSNQLSLPNDLNTAFFNFASGLPGLYQSVQNQEVALINHQLGQAKVHIQLMHGLFDTDARYNNPKVKRAYVFFDPNQDRHFYRASVILTGFPFVEDNAIAPQNIMASYMKDVLSCQQYLTENLIDKPYDELKQNGLLTNYSNGYLSIVYKDKSMLFYGGQLVTNETFSSGLKVVEPLDLSTVQEAISRITSKRMNKTQ